MNLMLPSRLVTVTSPEFLLGTRVMLDSLQRHNGWFDGEIIVLHSRLGTEACAKLEAQFPSLTCRLVSAPLADAIARLVDAFPHLRDRRDRFLSLELLLMKPQATLFLDSDMLVTASFADLQAADGELIACADASILRGRTRDPATMEEVDASDVALITTFNAGMMVLGRNLPLAELGRDMLAMLNRESWGLIKSDHTDQAVWNRLMPDRVRLVDPCYNFMLGHAGLYPAEQSREETLRALHFNGRAKPWLPEHHQAAAGRGALTGWAFGEWRQACSAMLSRQPT
jgi:lipopolysaccharide biosynthesis glycosyltransferase